MAHNHSWEALGSEIRRLREARGWTLKGLGEQLRAMGHIDGTSSQHLSSVELGNGIPSQELVEALGELFNAQDRLLRLFTKAKVPDRVRKEDSIRVVAHLFFPAFVSEMPELKMTAVEKSGWIVPEVHTHSCSDSANEIYLFPFNLAVAHEVHNLTTTSLTEITQWRKEQIDRTPNCLKDHLQKEMGWDGDIRDPDPYCFTCFEVDPASWDTPERLDRAVQLLACPSLLRRQADSNIELALETEMTLLNNTEPLHDLVQFTISRSHIGWASWAAVAIAELHENAGAVDHLIELEVQLQALWCYSSNVEHFGEVVSPNHGRSFIRKGLRSLQRPRATEHTSTRVLREALIVTSRIEETVTGACDALIAES